MRTQRTSALLVSALGAFCIGCQDFGTPTIPLAEDGNFIVFVSNQSSEVDPVDIQLYIDGRLAVDQDFAHRGGHNWIEFEYQLEGDTHTLRCVSRKGQAETSRVMVLSASPWAVVDYWRNGTGGITVSLLSQPPLFR